MTEYRKRTRAVHADALRMGAHVAAARHAVAAAAAHHVAFARDDLADLEVARIVAHVDDLADKFMADDHGHRNGLLRPFVPFPDMHVGAADGGAAHFDEDVVDAHFGLGAVLHPQAGFGLGLDQ